MPHLHEQRRPAIAWLQVLRLNAQTVSQPAGVEAGQASAGPSPAVPGLQASPASGQHQQPARAASLPQHRSQPQPAAPAWLPAPGQAPRQPNGWPAAITRPQPRQSQLGQRQASGSLSSSPPQPAPMPAPRPAPTQQQQQQQQAPEPQPQAPPQIREHTQSRWKPADDQCPSVAALKADDAQLDPYISPRHVKPRPSHGVIGRQAGLQSIPSEAALGEDVIRCGTGCFLPRLHSGLRNARKRAGTVS